MSDDECSPITIALKAEEYAQLTADAEQRGISLPALLDEIIAAEIRRLRRAERERH